MEQTKETHDQYYEMAHAPVGRVISKLAVPTIISMLVTSIYNMADTFFVSQLGTSVSGATGVVFALDGDHQRLWLYVWARCRQQYQPEAGSP